MNATIYRDMPASAYHALEAVNATSLKAGRTSMAHMRLAMKGDSKSTPATQLGELAHLAVLEPAKFDQVQVAPDFGDQRTKAGKEAKAAWLANIKPGDHIADIDDHNAAKAMGEACRGHGDIATILAHTDGLNELVVTWTDEETGLACKARLDRIIPGRAIFDLKTARNATRHGFTRAIAAYGYLLQAAWYSHAAALAFGADGENLPFIFGVVESSAPYGVAAYAIDQLDIERAAATNRQILRAWADAVASGRYSSIQPDGLIQALELPSWVTDSASVAEGDL